MQGENQAAKENHSWPYRT